MPELTSRQHPLVKEFRDLAKGGGPAMLLDGWHVVAEALAAGVVIDTLAVCGPVAATEKTILDRARRSGTQVVDVAEAVMNVMSPVKSPTGVVARAARPRLEAKVALKPSPALVLSAIGVQDPGNVGAIIRAAAAAGCTGIMVDEASADPWGWKALRASMGSVFHVPVIRHANVMASLDACRTGGLQIVAAVPRHGTSMYELDFSKPMALLLGAEGAGLPLTLLKAADARVSIPMSASVESLNVAVAASLLLYEARRQRRR
ncbi:MAG: RNA methyltransferase [Vicinamibacterales bacterium]